LEPSSYDEIEQILSKLKSGKEKSFEKLKQSIITAPNFTTVTQMIIICRQAIDLGTSNADELIQYFVTLLADTVIKLSNTGVK